MWSRRNLPCVLLMVMTLCQGIGAECLPAADWPTYRGNQERSNYTAETLPGELSLAWQYDPGHAPQPAWSGRDTRTPYDRAYQPVVAGGLLLFGSSADCQIHALDAATGAARWTFFTDGPVRFAPVVWEDRVLAASDDGHLYCLTAAEGRLVWKIRGGPEDDMVLGNGRMVSRWPARGGPVVADGVVYFGAGIWPSEGIFVYAVDARSGKVLWCNSDSGGIYMPQPHGGANAKSGISAHGDLVVAGDVLLVPTGRAVPAALDRSDGKLRYFHLQRNVKYGGSDVLAADGQFINRGITFDVATGSQIKAVPPQPHRAIAALPGGLATGADGSVEGYRWAGAEAKDRKGKPVPANSLEALWSVDAPYAGTSLVIAGQGIVSAGRGAEGYGVCLVDIGAKKSVWSATVDADPWGAAVADGRLYVSTEKGTIYCFQGGPPREPGRIGAGWVEVPVSQLHDKAAHEIVRQSGVTEGYCIDLGCGDGSLALALAARTDLQIYAVDPDPEKAAAARKRISDAGLYGVRITVHEGNPAATFYPNHCANLVISGRSLETGSGAVADKEVERLQRPYGGVACVGKPGAMKKSVRGPLEGAGSWTHQYCNPANTNCSSDERVKGRLGMLWFGDLNFPMPSRHGRGHAPLVLDGRMFVEGLDALRCVDPYNGRTLWEYPLPDILGPFDGDPLMGTSGTSSNFCVTPEAVYVHTGDKCLRLDPATGKLLAEFPTPPEDDGTPGTWGYIACVDGTLFGTRASTEHVVTYRFRPGRDMSKQFTESTLLFAMDATTGELKWRYQPQQSIRHNTIAVGAGRVYLIDRAMALGDRTREKRRGKPDPDSEHPTGALIALDAADGQVVWKTDENIYGTLLALSVEHETLLMCYQDWRFKLASEVGGRVAAFDTATGQRRWEIEAKYMTRPVINDQTVYLQPSAWDLLTGEKTDFEMTERSYGCGILAGSKNLLVYRSATLGYTDLLSGSGTENYGGIRPACWINTLPAAGLVLMPDATDRCTCSYLLKASIALEPRASRK